VEFSRSPNTYRKDRVWEAALVENKQTNIDPSSAKNKNKLKALVLLLYRNWSSIEVFYIIK